MTEKDQAKACTEMAALLAAHAAELAVMAAEQLDGEEVEVPKDYFATVSANISEGFIELDELFESEDDGGPDDDGGLPLPSNVLPLRKIGT